MKWSKSFSALPSLLLTREMLIIYPHDVGKLLLWAFLNLVCIITFYIGMCVFD